jgi:DNA-binding XRE family transcriptional regulator
MTTAPSEQADLPPYRPRGPCPRCAGRVPIRVQFDRACSEVRGEPQLPREVGDRAHCASYARRVTRDEPGLLPALLRHFRTRRGLSQLDLALAAGISARHLSFLETGRAQPSREMVLRLGGTLALSLRDQNALLRALAEIARVAA